MGQSYRIRTEIGTNKTINIQLDQDFEFLEILSIKLQQADVYNRDCANYGVVVGRVTANNGFGIPNAKVSIFIPILPVDESNPIVTSIYPYKSPEERNEDGYRYNLLPYEKSYSTHAATGTFPSLSDALSSETAIEIYDTYYKLTSKTNDSGDYMIMGVPLGAQTIVMDVDLSDIGEFSLSPQDLIRMGLATEAQVGGNTFKTSTDLNSLPQIINIVKTIEVSPLWGDETLCQIAINRLDFDLRDDANVDINPTSVFMGSMFSSPENMRVRPGFKILGLELTGGAKPKDNLGNLCNLVAGPGQILCIRQTIQQDTDGNPILEEYKLEKSGNVIDGDGTWLVEVPMNLDYITTNEFGDKIISNDPKVGIPTKGKYRFKIKWQQPPDLTQQTRRAYYLVPNIKEYGWGGLTDCDPNMNYANGDACYTYYTSPAGIKEKERIRSSYYFGLDWSGYTQGFDNQDEIDRLNEVVNCEDTFYEFNYNKVYTISSLIDQWKRGGRGRFIGIKEIDDDDCDGYINKFPTNEGFRNFDFLFFLFSILLTVISFTVIPLLIVAHIILFLYQLVIDFICLICNIPIFGFKPFQGLCSALNISCNTQRFTIRLPMITYPECSTCECKTGDLTSENVGGGATGVLSYLSLPGSYVSKFQEWVENSSPFPDDSGTLTEFSVLFAQAMSGNDNINDDKNIFKVPKSDVFRVQSRPDEDDLDRAFAYSTSLPVGERVNIFNSRSNYFNGLNRIKVSFDYPNNLNFFHYDNTITVLSNREFNSGDLLTTVDIATTSDINFTFTASTPNGIVQGVPGTSVSGPSTIQVRFASQNDQDVFAPPVTYNLSTGTTLNRQKYPSDREYFQVLTAITISQASQIWNTTVTHSFPNILNAQTSIKILEKDCGLCDYDNQGSFLFNPMEYFDNIEEQYILIIQRGVDPYSPKFTNKYSIGKILGLASEDDIYFTANTRLNIPIQPINPIYDISVQRFVKDDMYYESKFFSPGPDYSGFTSSSVGYYGELDKSSQFLIGFGGNTPTKIFTSGGLFGLFGGLTVYASNLANPSNIFTKNSGPTKYDNSEDLSGGSCMYMTEDGGFERYNEFYTYYYSKTLYGENITYDKNTRQFNVLRTDRLPSSDKLNGPSWETAALLQQNNNFDFYIVPDVTNETVIPTFATGAQQTQPEIEGQPGATKVLSSFDCPNMVSLKCYEGIGDNFNINQKCVEKDNVENGCYLLLRRPLIDLLNGKDFNTYSEWSLRFRFFYGMCRGVLSQSFTNNWINGTLFAFPIQVNTFYDSLNQPYSDFSRELIYFDQSTTNFYYRSSPYDLDTNEFVGKKAEPSGLFNFFTAVNERNLLFPTTIMDLGMKEKFYSEIIYEPYSRGYVMSNLDSTSYGDNSDLVNLFVISRITDAGFLDGLFDYGDNSINELFTRNTQGVGFITANLNRRVDGDFAQAISINSEVGLVKFSPEYYEVPPCDDIWCETHCCKIQVENDESVVLTFTYKDCNQVFVTKQLPPGAKTIVESIDISSFVFTIGTPPVPATKFTKKNFGCATNESPTRILADNQNQPTMAIWYSSTTENLQLKDFITPGRINFRTNDLLNNFPFNYGIKSQKVPFYQWKIEPTNHIFGTQFNNWYTKQNFFSGYYQSLDRTIPPPTSYFQSSTAPQTNDKDLYQRGYIFSVDQFGNYSVKGSPINTNRFLVGAPFHFYFGINRGFSALDKFKTKYSTDE